MKASISNFTLSMLALVGTCAWAQPQDFGLPKDLPPVPPNIQPYVAILEPQFIPASEATFLEDDFIVIGVAKDNIAKAYPAADLAQHGSVNDQMPDGPIEVTWCGTCNTGVVFQAKLKGRLLHFDYDSMMNGNEVHKDRETGSRWQQATGEAISGPLKGSHLELYPFVRTSWKEWQRRYPNTLVLKPLPGYAERIQGLGKRQKAMSLINIGKPPKEAFGKDGRLPPREIVAGLEIGNESKAYPFTELRIAGVVNDKLSDIPVVVIHQKSSDTTTAFEARAKEKTLHFKAVSPAVKMVMDLETQSTWDPYGLSVAGPMKGTQLRTLVLVGQYWFAWSQFRPATKV